jgi:hypothetical protein
MFSGNTIFRGEEIMPSERNVHVFRLIFIVAAGFLAWRIREFVYKAGSLRDYWVIGILILALLGLLAYFLFFTLRKEPFGFFGDLLEVTMTPLHRAALRDNFEEAEFLIASGADIDARDAGGEAPLHYAAREGYLRIVKLLVQGGADINARSHRGSTPFALAVEKGHGETAEFLKRSGADTAEFSNVTFTTVIPDEGSAEERRKGTWIVTVEDERGAPCAHIDGARIMGSMTYSEVRDSFLQQLMQEGHTVDEHGAIDGKYHLRFQFFPRHDA